MNILYCGDQKMEDGLLLSTLSILNHTEDPLHIFVLTMRLSTETRNYNPISSWFAEDLKRLVKEKNPENQVTRVDLTETFSREMPYANLDTHFTPYCMLRLFADKIPIPPQSAAACPTSFLDRILYLDADVICRRDFSDFYHQDLSGYEIAGVPDHYGRWLYSRDIRRMDYLNSGVLLLNMEAIKKTRLMEKCRELCADKQMFLPDQTALNRLCSSKKKLPRRFNEQRKLKENTVFQHFTTSFRILPWLHTVTVKPWEVEKMHSKLKLHEYDSLLETFTQISETRKKQNQQKDQVETDEQGKRIDTNFLYH